LFEEPVSLKAAESLPALAAAGVRAIKIEGRQRGRTYVTTALHRSIVANNWLSPQ
jgi:O2-independent ubiquinone biosynthesis protein UbiU